MQLLQEACGVLAGLGIFLFLFWRIRASYWEGVKAGAAAVADPGRCRNPWVLEIATQQAGWGLNTARPSFHQYVREHSRLDAESAAGWQRYRPNTWDPIYSGG